MQAVSIQDVQVQGEGKGQRIRVKCQKTVMRLKTARAHPGLKKTLEVAAEIQCCMRCRSPVIVEC